MSAALRLKMVVNSVKKVSDNEGNVSSEELELGAVYSNKIGSANAQWCKWTPFATFKFTISNPEAFGKALPGRFFYVDLTETDKDSL